MRDCRGGAARDAFSLVECVVVVGIVTILIGLFMPVAVKVRRDSQAVKCRAQLQQIGAGIANYAALNNGVVIPMAFSTEPMEELTWRVALFGEPWPSVIRCPTAPDYERQSYLLNTYLWDRVIRLHGGNTYGVPPSEIVVAGENIPAIGYDYLPIGWPLPSDSMIFDAQRHGKALRTNYLWLDFHVDNAVPARRHPQYSAWDVPRPREDMRAALSRGIVRVLRATCFTLKATAI